MKQHKIYDFSDYFFNLLLIKQYKKWRLRNYNLKS
jgi:hypothetical protein